MPETNKRIVHRIPSAAMFTTGQYYKPKTKVVAYARVSTEKEEQEDSFERQVQHYTNLITSKPEWEFGGIYADPGITGTRAEKRPDFMRMIQDCRDGRINKIMVKSISRFARNTVDALNYIRELKDLGISVYFENENIDTMTPGGEVLLTILAAMAEQESRTMSTNIKWSYQKKFQNGEVILNTGTVLGYKKSKKGEYMIAEDEAETVRRVFREYVAGIPVPQICRRLEASGIKTKRGSAKWSTNAVLGIIKNEKYTGNAILGKTFKPDVLSKRRIKNTGQAPMYYAENTHPAIIEQELFDMAQIEMQRRKNEKDKAVGSSRYTGKYPFSGLLVCGTCGHRLRRHVRTVGNGKHVAAWGCTNRINNGRGACDSYHINEDEIERAFIAAFGDVDTIIDILKQACAQALESESAEIFDKNHADIMALQETVLELHRSHKNGTISDKEYEIRIISYGQQMDALQEKQKKLKAASGRHAEVYSFLDGFRDHMKSGAHMNEDDAVVVRMLTEKIVIYDERMEIFLKSGEILEQQID